MRKRGKGRQRVEAGAEAPEMSHCVGHAPLRGLNSCCGYEAAAVPGVWDTLTRTEPPARVWYDPGQAGPLLNG